MDHTEYKFCCKNLERACHEVYFFQPIQYNKNKSRLYLRPMLDHEELPLLSFPLCPWCGRRMDQPTLDKKWFDENREI